jgi:Ca2+-binding RTX toxin-like protein
MAGLSGDDTYIVDNAGDTVTEAAFAGTDTVVSSVNYALPDNVENLQLTGSAITGTGNSLSNVISGTTGNNTLDGGTGAGIDTVSYLSGAKSGVTVNLALTTPQNTVGSGVDTLSNFENVIGSTSSDHLTGTSGNNVIMGSSGQDTLTGAGGADIFVYTSAGDSPKGAASHDIITDFSNFSGASGNADKIDVRQFDSDLYTANTQHWILVINAASTVGGQMNFNTTTGILSFDQITGLGQHSVTAEIQLTGVTGLQAADFLLV